MIKKHLFVLLILLCTVSCTKDDMVRYTDYPILFEEEGAAETRAIQVNDNKSLREMGIWGYYTDSLSFSDASKPNFMWNQAATKAAGDDAVWSYTPLKYWPKGKQYLSFFAYSPLATGTNGITPSGNNVSGRPYIDITVPKEARFQPDLILSRPLIDVSSENPLSPVKFSFMHALSEVSFISEGIRIISISIKGAVNSGHVIPLGNDQASSLQWTDQQASADSEFTVVTADGEYLIDEDSGHGESSETGMLMMIPQKDVSVDFHIVYQKFTLPNPVTAIEKQSVPINWPIGQQVIYKITLSQESKLVINLFVENGQDSNWEDHNYPGENIGG